MKLRTTFYVLIVLCIVSTIYPITSLAQDSSAYMYWTDSAWGGGTPKLQRATLDGSNVQDLVTGIGYPIGIALDLAEGKMYWTDKSANDHRAPNATNRILRSNLDGTGIETLVSTRSAPQAAHTYFDIALDTASRKIYWVVWSEANDGNKIQRANLDGTNIETLIILPIEDTVWIGPRDIALDLSLRKMYWTNTAGKIQRANLDGSNVEDLVIGLVTPHNLALDFRSRKIYWADWSQDKIQRANFDESNVEDVVTSNTPVDIELDSLNGKMYWAGWGEGKIQRANLDGSNVEDLVTGLSYPWGIALGIPLAPPDDGLRFSPNVIADQTFTVGTYTSLTLPIATGGTPPYTYTLSPIPVGLYFDPATRQIHGTPTTATPATLATYTATDATGQTASLTFTITVTDTSVASKYIYWASWSLGKIQRANLDGTNLQDLVTGLTWPRDVALDIAGNKMYWVDAGANKVQRANLDGTNLQDLVNTQGQPFGVAVDTTNGKMYWSIWNPGKIRRANLDGTNVEDFVTGLSEPEDIDLDLSRGKIYWTDTVTNKIQRANLDGSNVEDLVTVGLSHPLGMALDVAGGKMYWTNTSLHPGPWPGLDKIQRANLDGTNVEDLVTTGLVAAHGIALDVSVGKMYWADAGIHRANLDGSNVEMDIIPNSGATGIALGIPQSPPGTGLRFDPNVIADQTFTVGTYASLNLPVATGGTEPYSYTLTPNLPAGLQFDAFDRWIGGTPTTPMPPTPYAYTAMDTTGASAALTFTITVTSDGTSNLDVNGDGQVTVIDLAIVALSYGTQVPVGVSLPADVNTDGVVDILDLTAVAQGIDAAGGGLNQLSLWEVEAALLAAAEQVAEIGVVAGAPMGFGTGQHALSNGIVYGNVAAALADARRMTVGDVRLGKGMAVLEGLLQLLAEMGVIPETTALLPNYPNPFNPETWIPYQLATAADVTLTVYDMRGVAVRQLVLGHQPAGVYQSRGRAAYWNGRNDLGELVASGVYFYTLTTGDFVATRKLLIAK